MSQRIPWKHTRTAPLILNRSTR